MNKIRLLANIVIVCIILIIAIYFPNIVSSYLQKSLEGKLSFVDVGVKTYEVEYNNIREKIASINQYKEEYGELKTVPIVTEVTEELKENLTKQVSQQLKKIQKGISYEFSSFNKVNLISCEKYVIYISDEANGISFWKLKYQKKEEDIQIIMDTEFNYIYVFKLESRLKETETIFKQCIKRMEELLDVWQRNICNYFEFDLESGVIYIVPSMKYEYEQYYSDKKNIINFDYFLCDETIMDNMQSSSSTVEYKKNDISHYGYYNIPIKMRYEYQKKEKKLIIDWGLGFFDSMIQF